MDKWMVRMDGWGMNGLYRWIRPGLGFRVSIDGWMDEG